MLYNLSVELRRSSDPRITMRGLTHTQLMYEIRRLPHYAAWTIKPFDADKPSRMPAALVCCAWPASPPNPTREDAGLRPNNNGGV